MNKYNVTNIGYCAVLYIGICASVYTPFVHASVTDQQVSEVSHRIQAVSSPSISTSVEVSNCTEIFSYMRPQRPYRVKVSSALLDFVQSSDEMAVVIAHEHSHVLNGINSKAGVEDELNADRTALKLLKKAGFNYHAGYDLYMRLSKIMPGGGDTGYPLATDRAAIFK